MAGIFSVALAFSPIAVAQQAKPNIVVIMADDAPPFDISAYHRGLGSVTTKNIDRIAREGLMVSDYYAQPSCTAGRAAFITGQYPIRTGLTSVGQPGSPVGLQKEDVTLAQLLKTEGYATAQFGKSHVGDRNEFLPTVHGFDEFYGFLYHLNMMEMPEQTEFPTDPNFAGRPRNVIYAKASDKDDATVDPRWGRVGRQVITDDGPLGAERQKTFDNVVLDRSLAFVKANVSAKTPFFLWFNPSRMHQQIHVSKEWEGKSGHSAYADALLHLDWLVGQVLDEVDRLGIRDNTIILFTSDNGVNLAHWPNAGTAAFRGEKGTTWDGGFRVPMLVRWPGKIMSGQWTGELMASEDWLPTLMAAAGADNVKDELLKGKKIGSETFKVHLDGYNQLDMLTGKGPTKRHEFFFYGETELNAARVDQWKVHIALKNEWLKSAEKVPGGLVIDIKLDPFERTPEAPGHFGWMKEKSWILPILAPHVNRYVTSLRDFPPRQKGTGVGAAALSGHVNEQGPVD
ncbi:MULTISPECIES: arylsulfatase [unclassified Bradyrhizobium]|uniref:arylsulfatase n=1 Tax=unclassified Bradyrhizobium TaxID=2631580 RepID=UPI002FF2BDA4